MNTLRKLLALSFLVWTLVACGGDGDKARYDAGEPESDAAAEPDMSAEGEDAGAQPVGPVPLTVWVDDLIDHRTTDEAEPDTVDDKLITDDTDETSFDKYLP